MKAWWVAALVLTGCFDFDGARRAFCVKHPGVANCLDDGGTGAGGGGGGSGGGGGGPFVCIAGTQGGGENTAAATGAQIGAWAAACPMPSAPGAQIYVSHDGGNDMLNDGGWHSPLATIGAGLTAASKLGLSEVRVCAGVYTERVVMTDPSVSLLGGFDCATGQRSSGCFDPRAAGSFEAGSGVFTTSIVDPGAPPGGAVTTVLLAFDGGTAGNPPTLEMFTIVGADGGSQTRAVEIAGSVDATPFVSNNRIFGGSTQCTAPVEHCNTGLVVSAGAPSVQFNLISGGTGTIPTGQCASCGVVLTGPAAPSLISNVILGGAGAMNLGGSPSIGLVFDGVETASGTNAVEQNDINGGSGACLTDGCAGVAGVYFSPRQTTDVDLRANQIRGTDPMAPVNIGSEGVLVEATGPATITISGNKVFSGNSRFADQPLTGIDLETKTATVKIYNNMIYAGDPVQPDHDGQVTGILYGPRLSNGETDVAHNAIVAFAGVAGHSQGLSVSFNNDRGIASLVVNNNIFVSNGREGSTGFSFDGCPQSPDLSIELNNNLFDGPVACGVYTGTDIHCWPTAVMVRPDVLDIGVGSGAFNSALGDLEYTGGCDSTNQCVCRPACTTTTSCVAEIFGAWDAGSFGYDELFTAGQWNLDPNPASAPPSCELVSGGTDDTAEVMFDFYGNPRDAPTTIGPIELNANTCALTGP